MPVNLAVFEQFNTISGIRIGTTNAGVKQTERPDIVIFELADTTSTAGIFTENAFCAAPVQISKKHLAAAQTRYLIINTGNANAGTGQVGYDNALEICRAVAEEKKVTLEQVLPFSTGVIGERLPMAKILPAIPNALSQTQGDAWFEASRGIMTTDTQPKGISVQFEFEGQTIAISGISKGAGMIKPNMATMLGFIATDAPVEQALLQEICSELGEKSFNRISIDGDTSTNDSCMLMATGTAPVDKLTNKQQPLYTVLKAELEKVFLYLAHAIVRDGEGATKFVAINVENCENAKEALRIAYTVAHSPLVKTALFASDANWGRILAAVGRSGVQNMDVEKINIFLNDVCIVENGACAASYTEEAGSAVMKQAEISIRIEMGRGGSTETVWTTDLSHEYVSINADYRS